jgi:hypothetical protein
MRPQIVSYVAEKKRPKIDASYFRSTAQSQQIAPQRSKDSKAWPLSPSTVSLLHP